MANEKISLLELLQNRLKEELEYKDRCDRGEEAEWDSDCLLYPSPSPRD